VPGYSNAMPARGLNLDSFRPPLPPSNAYQMEAAPQPRCISNLQFAVKLMFGYFRYS